MVFKNFILAIAQKRNNTDNVQYFPELSDHTF